MDALDWLKVVISRCSVLTRPGEALALAPDLAADAPVLVRMPLGGGWAEAFPVAFARVLGPPLCGLLLAQLAPYGQEKPPEDPSRLSPQELTSDPLVRALASLLVEAAALGPRSQSLVLLELARQSASVLSGQHAGLQRFMRTGDLAQVRDTLKRLEERSPDVARSALRGVGLSLSARIGAAWSLAAQVDPSIRPTRLYQALARNRLAFVYAAGTLEAPAAFEAITTIRDLRSDPGTLGLIHRAVAEAVRSGLGRDGVAAQGLKDLAGERTRVDALALDPDIAEWALHALDALTDAKALTKAGVPKDVAKSMLHGEGVAAMAASYREALEVLREWDLLSAAAQLAVPVWSERGSWGSTLGELSGAGPWALLGPRGRGGVIEVHAVVVFRGRLLEAIAAKVRESGSPAPRAAAQRLWLSLRDEAARRSGVLGREPWVAAFTRADDAEAFKKTVERVFDPPIRIEPGALGEPFTLSEQYRPDIELRSGQVLGGWDGRSLVLQGGPLEGARPDEDDETDDGVGAFFTPAPPPPSAAAPAGASAPDPFLSRAAAQAPRTDAPLDDDPFSSADFGEADESDDPFTLAPPPEPAAPPPPKPAPASFALASSSLDTASDLFGESLDDPFADDPFADSDAPDEGLLSEDEPGELASLDDPFAELDSAEPGRPGLTAPSDDSDVFAALGTFGDDSVDPLDRGAGVTLTPQAIAWEDAPDAALFDEEPPTTSPGIVSFEIDDDDDSEVSGPTSEEAMYFLPPPIEGHLGPPPDDRDDVDLNELEPESSDGLTFAGASWIDDSSQQARALTEELDAFSVPDFGDVLDDTPPATEQLSAARSLEELLEYRADASVESTPPPERAKPPAQEMLRLSAAEVAYMFNGYVCFRTRDSLVFGRRYGNRLVDAHSYPLTPDHGAEYRAFLMDKIREGFVPQTDLIATVPGGISLEDLDLELVGRSLSDMGTG
ncbi:MAG: hypothetical protein H6739_13945 [Alphaproteobacteria bacterium]|nr:hypothetical protein [Alphaproteobacteria bacterium]